MKFTTKILLLISLSVILVIAVFIFKRISQPVSYHDFADKRTFVNIPNFLNVVTNLPFIVTGLYGLILVGKSDAGNWAKIEYGALFSGILLTSIGSAYYHCNPNNTSLVWDRIPMTVVFMSLTAATISEYISRKAGLTLLAPLILLGIGSVIYWHVTELRSAGDLRLYGFIQFYPIIFIPVVLLLFGSMDVAIGVRPLAWVVTWYIVAKLFEHFDKPVYDAMHAVSGHSLKHLAAALSTWYLVKLFRVKHRPGLHV